MDLKFTGATTEMVILIYLLFTLCIDNPGHTTLVSDNTVIGRYIWFFYSTVAWKGTDAHTQDIAVDRRCRWQEDDLLRHTRLLLLGFDKEMSLK